MFVHKLIIFGLLSRKTKKIHLRKKKKEKKTFFPMDQQMTVMNDRPPADTGQPFYCCSAAWLQPHSWNKCSHFFTKVKLQKWNLSKRRSMERKKRMLRICFWEHDASFSIWSHLEENWPKKKKKAPREAINTTFQTVAATRFLLETAWSDTGTDPIP